MKCIDTKENLDAFVDGEIEISLAEGIKRHLENCAACQAEFKSLQVINGSLKQNLRVSAPAFLDEKVLSAFKAFHEEKRVEKVREETQTEKIGWFGIQRFAFAATLILFALATISAFQIGKMSASEVSIVMPRIEENKALMTAEFAGSNPIMDERSIPTKFIEVPIVREKIIKVPVIKEKIVTKTIYADKDKENKVRSNVPAKNNLALKNSVKDNEYLTQTNLKGFQPVSDFKLKITKEENKDEK